MKTLLLEKNVDKVLTMIIERFSRTLGDYIPFFMVTSLFIILSKPCFFCLCTHGTCSLFSLGPKNSDGYVKGIIIKYLLNSCKPFIFKLETCKKNT